MVLKKILTTDRPLFTEWIDNYEIKCIVYPIDISVILEQLQIKCYYTDIENNADVKYCRKENQILVNKSQKCNSGLVRMILAHELWQCLMSCPVFVDFITSTVRTVVVVW